VFDTKWAAVNGCWIGYNGIWGYDGESPELGYDHRGLIGHWNI
jgi:hypothetical protein